jgi:hypothetical protein
MATRLRTLASRKFNEQNKKGRMHPSERFGQTSQRGNESRQGTHGTTQRNNANSMRFHLFRSSNKSVKDFNGSTGSHV